MALEASADARREELTRLVMAAEPTPFWLDRPDAPAAREPLRGDVSCDLPVIRSGFSEASVCRPPAWPATRTA